VEDANDEHVAGLDRGAAMWNEWRAKYDGSIDLLLHFDAVPPGIASHGGVAPAAIGKKVTCFAAAAKFSGETASVADGAGFEPSVSLAKESALLGSQPTTSCVHLKPRGQLDLFAASHSIEPSLRLGRSAASIGRSGGLQHIADLALMIDRAPQVHPPAGDPNDHLIEVAIGRSGVGGATADCARS